MSATPREVLAWALEETNGLWDSARRGDCEQALSAFDALLAVAKASDAYLNHGALAGIINDALVVLDARHPGWREWSA